MPSFPKIVQNKDKTFGPTLMGHFYQPPFYHNRTAAPNPDKHTWLIKLNEQYEVFRLADEGRWLCQDSKALFSIIDDGKFVLGSEDEVLGFFRVPVNINDTWHGFPVKSEDKAPSSDLLDFWIKNKIISNITRIRIERRAL